VSHINWFRLEIRGMAHALLGRAGDAVMAHVANDFPHGRQTVPPETSSNSTECVVETTVIMFVNPAYHCAEDIFPAGRNDCSSSNIGVVDHEFRPVVETVVVLLM
jgi:hypothetical protein